MKNDKRQVTGYSFTVEDEKILAYMKLTTEEKLKWLEEINSFTFAALTEEEWKIRQKLRSGEV